MGLLNMKILLRSQTHLPLELIILEKKLLYLISIILFSVILESCSTVYIDATKCGKDIAWTDSVNRSYTVLKHFSQERKAYFVVLGLFKVGNPDVVDVISTEIAEAEGDAAVNTKLEVEYDLIDTIIPYGIGAIGWAFFGPAGFNLSFAFNTQTYRISGDVIRYVK
jgi:hypothetical protein